MSGGGGGRKEKGKFNKLKDKRYLYYIYVQLYAIYKGMNEMEKLYNEM